MGAIEHPPIFSLAPLGIPDHVFYAWVVMAILIAVSVAATRNLQMAPRGLQNFMEVVLEIFLNLLDEVIGHDGRTLPAPDRHVGAVHPHFQPARSGPRPGRATANMYTTIACAVIVFVYYHYLGIRKQGFVGYLKHFCGPVPWLAPLMFPIEVVSHWRGCFRSRCGSSATCCRAHPARRHFPAHGTGRALRLGADGQAGRAPPRAAGRRGPDRLHRRLPAAAEDSGGVSAGVRLLPSVHGLHFERR